MTWLQVRVETASGRSDAVEDALLGAGALSVTLEDAGETPVLEPEPGSMPLWDRTFVVGLFEGSAERTMIADALSGLTEDAGGPPTFETLPDREWERAWMDDWTPLRFGQRLWVAPLEASVDEPGAVVLRLDPGLAFGTGTHTTTALCLEWLDDLSLGDRTLLDYGCGSGILAIAALRLGARSALGVDIDPQALEATRDNAETNGVVERVATAEPDADPGGPFDVIVANILAGPLMQSAATLAALQPAGGHIALAGVLADQAHQVIAAYAPWYSLEIGAERDEWVRLEGRRTQSA